MRALLMLPFLLALAFSGCGGPGDAAASKPDVDGCAGSQLLPTPANEAQVKAATLCLVNAQRARVGAGPLKEHALLDHAAVAHSRDMAERDFFEHRNPDGVQPDGRIVQHGYPPILVGENLAWGEERKSVPAEIVRMWLGSPGHRRNMLEPRYVDIGIGMAYDAPEPQDHPRQAAIYTTTFGAGGR